MQVEDAYRALELLEKHPGVDPARIVHMEFSQGGSTTLCAALKRCQRYALPCIRRPDSQKNVGANRAIRISLLTTAFHGTIVPMRLLFYLWIPTHTASSPQHPL
ncbi:acetylxylan esterase [Paraburkholderia hospita]|uniref:acetylxylan esterase n=1 Tax=Paraburkholderia hospita TaxID=169430 RepID=UPI001FC970CA|nr:acetylxylan esterase [Paraburkholderia hospita]